MLLLRSHIGFFLLSLLTMGQVHVALWRAASSKLYHWIMANVPMNVLVLSIWRTKLTLFQFCHWQWSQPESSLFSNNLRSVGQGRYGKWLLNVRNPFLKCLFPSDLKTRWAFVCPCILKFPWWSTLRDNLHLELIPLPPQFILKL